jgi:hypothetical protein
MSTTSKQRSLARNRAHMPQLVFCLRLSTISHAHQVTMPSSRHAEAASVPGDGTEAAAVGTESRPTTCAAPSSLLRAWCQSPAWDTPYTASSWV